MLPAYLVFEGRGHRPFRYVLVGKREPKRGEFYVSGAIPKAYLAPNDIPSPYLVVAPVGEPMRQVTEWKDA